MPKTRDKKVMMLCIDWPHFNGVPLHSGFSTVDISFPRCLVEQASLPAYMFELSREQELNSGGIRASLVNQVFL
jgi:hypothetical protein